MNTLKRISKIFESAEEILAGPRKLKDYVDTK